MKGQVNTDNLFVALDIGTTKICALVAQQVGDNGLNILGIGKSQSYGVSRGVVVDIAQAVASIKLAIKEAELMAGCKIDSVYVGVSGAHIQSVSSSGIVPVKNGQIRESDIAAVLATAKAVVIPEGQQILHLLPKYYAIDGLQKVMDPVGMYGVRLEAEVHIITGSIASVQNIINCCQLAGLRVIDVILEPLASAQAVLSKDEQELGVGLLDIGGGTSDFAVYQQGTIRHTKIFGVAGNHVTHDIALCLRTTIKDAERIKREHGHVGLLRDTVQQFQIELVHGAEHAVARDSDLLSIIEPRIEELVLMLSEEINQQHLHSYIQAGLVLTGGGSLLQGIKDIFQNTLTIPVRIGKPHVPTVYKESLESPVYATSYGLLLHALKSSRGSYMDQLTGPLLTRILWRMKSWVSDFF